MTLQCVQILDLIVELNEVDGSVRCSSNNHRNFMRENEVYDGIDLDV